MARKLVLLFPGQGAQRLGMAADFYEHYPLFRDVIHHVETRTHLDLWKVIQGGPEKLLKSTVYAQMALLAVELGLMQLLTFYYPKVKVDAFAGLSLGEYSGLIAAGVLRMEEGIDLVYRRAQLMQKCCESHPGGMVAAFAPYEEVEKLVARYVGAGVLQIANYNAPQQVVVSGSQEALSWFQESAKGARVKRLVELEVAGAFHTPLMQEAAQELHFFLERALFSLPSAACFSNVTGRPVEGLWQWSELLYRQLVSPVRWMQTIQTLDQQGYTHYVEMGPGKVLHGLNRRIAIQGATCSLDLVEDFHGLETFFSE